MRAGVSAGLVVIATLTSRAAEAQDAWAPVDQNATTPAPAPAPASPPTIDHWYGAPSVALDGAAFAIFYAGLAGGWSHEHASTDVLMITGYATYALGAPIVHIAHGNLGVGVRSFALRLFLPAAVTLLTTTIIAVDCFDDSFSGAQCNTTPIVLVPSITSVVFAAIDDVLLAHERLPAPPASPSSSFTIAPTFTVGRASTLGLAGTF